MTANRTIVEIHILQTMPPSNLNRDDTGSPKKAVYGGVTRARSPVRHGSVRPDSSSANLSTPTSWASAPSGSWRS